KGVIAQNLFKRIDKPGRVAALEILVVDMAIANLVREAKTHQIPGMIQVGKKKGNQPLDDAIIDHLRNARISPEEAYDKAIDKKKFRQFLKNPPNDWTDEETMRLPDLDKILSPRLHTHPGISDLNFSVGHPLQVESFGELKPALIDPPVDNLTPYQTEQVALALMQGDRRLMYDYLSGGSCDLSYSLNDEARFRVNIFRQRGNFAIVLRRLEAAVPTIESLQLPPIFREIAKEKTGLVLLTGATGSGKTTTLAAVLNEINETQAVHIVTLEDPIEFVHPFRKATFNQRELGQDFNNYPNGFSGGVPPGATHIVACENCDS